MHLIEKPKKSLGQNFLKDQNVINKIINIINIQNKTIMEIGSGYGDLTSKILDKRPKKVIAIEKDKNLSFFLREKFNKFNNIKIINKDILIFLKEENIDSKITVFGNLPYNISTKILSSLTLLKEWPPWYENLILMFQKEVADRIIAKVDTKNFSRLSVLCNWRLEIKKHFDISKNCFFPKPKVDSTILSFKPKKYDNFYLKDPKNLEFVTRILFSNRRKMINKSFSKIFNNSAEIAKELKINLKKRPGELNAETFYKIASKYEKLLN